MATHKSDLIAAKDSLAVSDKNKFNSNRTNATVLQATAVYTFKGTEQHGDVIELVDLPAGAIVIPHQSFVADSSPSALTAGPSGFRLGTESSPFKFGYVEQLYQGSSRNFSYQVLLDAAPLEKQTRVIATFDVNYGFTKDKKIAFGISYAING